MKHSNQLVREVRRKLLNALDDIQDCLDLVDHECKPNQSTYRVDSRHAKAMRECLGEALDCIKKALVSV